MWVALGYLFCPDDLTYLLLGVPLTIGFQLIVRRRPLRELWVRVATRLTLDRRGLVLAAVLVAAPAFYGVRALPGAHWPLIGWYIAAVVGAAGAAFALRATTPVALYFPLTFVIEEVAFRGALDAHIHHDGEGRGWLSAVFVSAVWGLWHLPFTTGMALPLLVAELLAVHILIGVPLSFAWRRSRNLAGPALAHAAIDAVRNALLGSILERRTCTTTRVRTIGGAMVAPEFRRRPR